MSTKKTGFTLIELLIVIAIIAILATTAVLVLNPSEILKKARDTQRIGDLETVASAIAYSLATLSKTPSFQAGSGFSCASNCASSLTGVSANCGGRNTQTPAKSTVDRSATPRAIDGNGWVALNFSAVTNNPLSILPMDPSPDNALTFYAYACDNDKQKYELSAVLEATDNVSRMKNDGGDKDSVYEVGSGISSL
ncbi:MAG: prepilin-type N-terminal cleavage/methylation domain-containing protein [Candidatus Harrisonbacteria bacterium]|nr:prepilin-type N-terminal cleavage/methylation domain-containing protein [Candidatus Harrisonbacteria bacterium]